MLLQEARVRRGGDGEGEGEAAGRRRVPRRGRTGSTSTRSEAKSKMQRASNQAGTFWRGHRGGASARQPAPLPSFGGAPAPGNVSPILAILPPQPMSDQRGILPGFEAWSARLVPVALFFSPGGEGAVNRRPRGVKKVENSPIRPKKAPAAIVSARAVR